MKKEERDRVLLNLAKIEIGFSKIYESFSKKKNFTLPVKKFWENIAKEERAHAEVFETIRKRLSEDPSYEIDTRIEISKLKEFSEKLKTQLNKIKGIEISESEAYSFGASLEAELCEADFVESLQTNDEITNKRLGYLRNADKKHNVIMINYAKGIK